MNNEDFDLEKHGPRDLFPHFKDQRTYAERRDYVEQVMLDKIRDNELFLTEVMLQGRAVMDISGDVLLGYSINEGGTQQAEPVDPELAEHKVHLRSINSAAGNPIKYRMGSKPTRKHMLRSKGVLNKNSGIRFLEAHYVDTGISDGLISLPAAYRAMKTAGKYIPYANARTENETWLVEEIPPWSPEHAESKSRPVPAKEAERKPSRARGAHG